MYSSHKKNITTNHLMVARGAWKCSWKYYSQEFTLQVGRILTRIY